MDEYRKALKTYNEINESRKEDAKARGEREGKAIQHLRSILVPEIMELVQRQRLNFLVKGTRFAKGKGKFVFCKLSPNHKAFYYGDWQDENVAPALENLDSKLPISEIKVRLC